ncbi:SHOCT domain-containing protein [Spirosoma sp. RP8]|uniref:SHOCT domain-containing protein n=1 Tax=Spirosoma liriopis TaxID=2937440 RepID=A0ABT0HE54_9BACT|nr:SHOCT domain-containing protein [Spirosoma liriopis]MCK8490431.1 SHOCT domain-containing protein [Spirosoma liriopis]
MKHLFTLILLLVFPLLLSAQTRRRTPVTEADLQPGKPWLYSEDFDYGYQTTLGGWIIKKGDTLQLGKGTLPDKAFAFIYENPASFTADYRNGRLIKDYLGTRFARKTVVVKDLSMVGTKKTGFAAVAIVSVGLMARYRVELANAFEAGEVIPPAKYRTAETSPVADKPIGVADELIKLKQLLDAGVLTQEEFNAQKKKLLN